MADASPRTSTPSPEPLGELFLATSRTLRRQTANALGPLGITLHQARSLRAVIHNGPMRLGVLADRLRIAPRSVTDVVDSLAEAGWVERSPDPDDRRATVIAATEAGLRQAEAVERVRRETSERFFGQLDSAERDALRRTLQGLLADGDHRSHRTEQR